MSATQKQKFLAPPLLGLNTTAQDSKVNVLDDDPPGDGEHGDYDHGDHDGGCLVWIRLHMSASGAKETLSEFC